MGTSKTSTASADFRFTLSRSVRHAISRSARTSSSLAARSSTARILSPMRRIPSAATEGDWISFAEHEADFHEALVARLGSPRLSDAFAKALRELRVALSQIDLAQAGDRAVPGYVREHGAILRRVAAAEEKRAAELLASHLDGSERMVLRHLRESVK